MVIDGSDNISVSSAVVAAGGISAGQQVKIANNAGTTEIQVATAAGTAHGIARIDLAADDKLSDEAAICWYGKFYNAIAGEALTVADAGARLKEETAGRLDKDAAGLFVFIPMKTTRNPTGAVADGGKCVVMRLAN